MENPKLVSFLQKQLMSFNWCGLMKLRQIRSEPRRDLAVFGDAEQIGLEGAERGRGGPDRGVAEQIDAEAEQIEAEERRSKSSKGGVDRGRGGADLDRERSDQVESEQI